MNMPSPSYLLAIAISVILGTFVLLSAPRKKSNIAFFMLCISLFFWFISLCYFTCFKNPIHLTLFAKIGLNGVTFGCFFYVYLVYSYFSLDKYKTFFRIYFVWSLFLGLWLIFGDNYIAGFHKYSWGYYPRAGIGETAQMCLMLVFMCFVYAFFINRVRNLKKLNLSNQDKNRFKYFALSVIFLGFILLDYLPKYGIDYSPKGHIFFIIFATLMAYAMIKHNILDINVVIRKGLIYSLLITLISIIYFLSALTAETLFRGMLGYSSSVSIIFTMTLIVLLFQPLKNKIQRLIDKYFFRGTIDQIDEENIKLREELQKTEKLKAVATLAAGMAHEIKNPLTSIKTFTEYIPKKKTDPEFLEKFHKIIGVEVDKINHIVRQLLEFSKPSELQLKETDINDLLDETLNLLNNDLLKHNIKVEKHYSTLPSVKVDPSQMKQVSLNLLLNAIDSMKNGGSITVATENNTNNQLIIKIKDTGTGISKEDLKHVFDPFFSKKDDGTGLGLSVVHGIIEKHGGKITVESSLEAGTSFEITLK